ncbi:uncharacterized protein LOC107613247 isoform X1 [Arachis ipaensis]|uniref:uncharacterized protein LOC107613247 isoform X1 n=1 Tax=Arachis ipaensis TaxID=130454 RepID=UPI0007AFD69B|nr:uncharacterized protein LOC107613247 isoform X1 [Arachis ipaensis]XP_025671074.1 uncharacterized protein LOC112770851 isoform X1 [Arachis hypogaea]
MLITHLSPLFLKLTESHSLTAGVALDLSRLRYLASLAAAFLPSLHRKQKQTEPVSGPSGGGRCRLFASAVNASFAVSWSLGRESLSLHWKESKQGQQSIFLKPQDKETAVCKPAVQEDLVGSREALCKASVINQGIENHREEWTRCSREESWN